MKKSRLDWKSCLFIKINSFNYQNYRTYLKLLIMDIFWVKFNILQSDKRLRPHVKRNIIVQNIYEKVIIIIVVRIHQTFYYPQFWVIILGGRNTHVCFPSKCRFHRPCALLLPKNREYTFTVKPRFDSFRTNGWSDKNMTSSSLSSFETSLTVLYLDLFTCFHAIFAGRSAGIESDLWRETLGHVLLGAL